MFFFINACLIKIFIKDPRSTKEYYQSFFSSEYYCYIINTAKLLDSQKKKNFFFRHSTPFSIYKQNVAYLSYVGIATDLISNIKPLFKTRKKKTTKEQDRLNKCDSVLFFYP